jgi:hypothetical protein
MRYTEPYQLISLNAWNSVEIFGIATDIIVVSIATRKVPRKSDTKIIASFKPPG